MLVAYFGVIFAWFVILFRRRYPRRTFRFVAISMRWTLRCTVLQMLRTERYPPFVMA